MSYADYNTAAEWGLSLESRLEYVGVEYRGMFVQFDSGFWCLPNPHFKCSTLEKALIAIRDSVL